MNEKESKDKNTKNTIIAHSYRDNPLRSHERMKRKK